MAGDEEKKPKHLEEAASSEAGTGTSASDVPASETPADDPSAASATEESKAAAEAKASEPAASSESPAAETAAEEVDPDSEQLALPGMPEEPKKIDPDNDPYHDDPHHHDDYDQYHDEYHEEHYHHDEYHDEYHHDEEHNDGHYEGFHANPYHDDQRHSAYNQGLTTGAAAASRVPLDQRSVTEEYEPELDEHGNPYGGPVKPFLDHLEDLRWTILKCVFSLLIAMLGCMMGAKYLVGGLMWPLKQARNLDFSAKTDVPVMLGHRTLGKLDIQVLTDLGMDTNNPVFSDKTGRFDLVPLKYGTNTILALSPRVPEQTTGFVTSFDEVMVELKNYGPFQSIWLCLQLALYGGLVIGAPFIIFFVAEFVLPALKVSEKKFLYKAAGIGSILFFCGVAFCYFLIVQVALRASVEFSTWLGFGADEWHAGEYLSFVVKFLLVMGLAFEMPVVLLTIVKIGLLDYKKLSEMRSYFVVGMLVASAVITPSGDPFTMVLVAIPLWILYEICVIIARVWYKEEKALEEAEANSSESSAEDKKD